MSRPVHTWWQRWLGRSDAVTIQGAGTFAHTRPGSHLLMWFILGFFVVMIVWAAAVHQHCPSAGGQPFNAGAR